MKKEALAQRRARPEAWRPRQFPRFFAAFSAGLRRRARASARRVDTSQCRADRKIIVIARKQKGIRESASWQGTSRVGLSRSGSAFSDQAQRAAFA
jgi:hypothetical protein